MGRIIGGQTQTDYPPLVGLRVKGNYVKGKVVSHQETKNGNPAITLELIDTNGSTSKGTAKGVYEEVDVNAGDHVQVIGSTKQLREKLPLLQVGDIATITFDGKIPLTGGRTVNTFTVEVDE